MGTPCYIGKDLGNGKYKAIFCKLDGYLEWTGALLLKHFNTPEKLDELLALGDINYLKEKLYPDPSLPHDYYGMDYQQDVTLAYGRDLGATGYEATEMTMDEMLDSDDMVEFIYMFTPEQEWKYLCTIAPDARIRTVSDELDEEIPDEVSEPTQSM